MTLATPDTHAVLTEPDTLEIRRLLPGPIERVWSYLTDSDLRSRWLAAGVMEGKVGSAFELTWRNDGLTDPAGRRPAGMPEEHRKTCRITAFDAPRRLGFTWDPSGGVTITLEPQGDEVLLTLVHHRLPDRSFSVNVSAGWHAHLDLLAARVAEAAPAPFWDAFGSLRADYEARIPA